jgi:DNA repair protein RadD
VILAHRKELVEQNAAELAGMYGGSIGIYAAALDKRDTMTDITYASIDSVFKKAGEFPPIDVIMIDEAHRIPVKGEGKYRTFIAQAIAINPNLRVVGLTATPYRVGSGPICHPQHILNHVCYEAKIGPLIEDGFLCPLRAKVSSHTPDISTVKKASTGDFIQRQLSAIVDVPELVQDAVAEIVGIINKEQRRSVVVFCVDIAHSKHVSQAFASHGIEAPAVTGKTSTTNRDKIVEDFRAGKTRVLCNVNVYTEGFNVKQVDCVVLLRPTASCGIYVQCVGRGLRLHPQKANCLVLDYGGNIERHGPIDALDGGVVKMAKCGECAECFSRALGACPSCGWVIPKKEVEDMERQEAERKMHDRKAAEAAILSTDEILLQVDGVLCDMHLHKDGRQSLRVTYRCGLQMIPEWVCLDHDGYAGKCARDWWAARFGWLEAERITLDDALTDMFLGERILNRTYSIVCVRSTGKSLKITKHNLKGQNER